MKAKNKMQNAVEWAEGIKRNTKSFTGGTNNAADVILGMQWQPIDTAPRDGRFIAIFDKEMAICCDATEPEDGKRWFRSDLHGAYPIDEIRYWMPLPEAPTERITSTESA